MFILLKKNSFKLFKAWICIAAALFIYGCGPPETVIQWNISSNDIVAPESHIDISIKANIYVDATKSMSGFAVNRDSIYNRFLNDIEGSIISGWKNADIGFYKFGTKIKELSREQFRGFNTQNFYLERGIFEKTDIDKVIETMDKSQVNIVVTDLFQADHDVNAMIRSIKDGCFAKDISIGIVGIKSDFDGIVYDAKVPPFALKSEKDNEETYRPFYALIFGEKNNIERLFAQIKYKEYIKDENFILISNYLVNGFDIVSMAKDRASRGINFQGSKVDKNGNKQFNFVMIKGANEGDISAEISFDRIANSAVFLGENIRIMAYKKTALKEQAGGSDKGEKTNDITLIDAMICSANKINIKLRVSTDDVAGNYSYLVYLQPGTVNGYIMPNWVEKFSSDNPTPGSDANKTLNLKQLIAGLLNANAVVSQPKIAQMIINLRKL